VEIDFTNLLVVVAVAFTAPLLLGLAPALRLPAVVLEIVAGIAVGPSGLGWVEVDDAVSVLSVIGLAMLLFLAGLEIELRELRGRVLRASLLGFAVSFAIAVAIAVTLDAAGLVTEPLFVAIVLAATSLGIIVPILKDTGEVGSRFGQLVIAASTIADFATIILLSLLFSRESTSATAQVVLLVAMFAAVALVALAVAGSSICARCATCCSACRTPRRRSACAAPSCCSSGSSPWPPSSASRSSSGRSWRARSSRWSTATR
jgi:Kef-type K+ transport system membrane component KefB